MVTTSTVLALTSKVYTFDAVQPEGGSGITIFADVFQNVEEDWLLFGVGRDLISFGPGEAWIG